MLKRLGLVLALALACATGAYAGDGRFRLLVANTAAETGVMARLVAEFAKRHPQYDVEMEVAGGLVVLERAREGRADAVVTHHPPNEQLFIADGYGVSRTLFMFNDFVLLGPPDDPLEIQRERDLVRVLNTLADAEVSFMVQGERSGTYQKLAELWSLAQIEPDWIGYEPIGTSSASTLHAAAAMGAYAFADIGTYLANRAEIQDQLVPLYRDHHALRNFYHYLVVNPETIPAANREAAVRFKEFLVSADGQSLIEQFGMEEFQTAVFAPAAHLDPGLQAEQAAAEIRRQQRTLYTVSSLALVLALSGIMTTFLYVRARRAERRRHASEQRFKRAVAGTNDGIWDWDLTRDHAYFSPRMLRILGLSSDSQVAEPLRLLLGAAHPDFRDALEQTLTHQLDDGDRTLFSTEFRLCDAVSGETWVMLRGRVLRDEQSRALRMSGSLSDISAAKHQQAAIEHQALHDALTDLPNRLLLQDRLEQRIGQTRRSGGTFALLMMDLDRFKEINDTLGHQIGDDILQQVALRLTTILGDSGTVARLGGDEFAVLLPEVSERRAKHTAEKIRLALKRTFSIKHHNLVIGASVGIAMYPEHGETVNALFQHADVAMYQAKHSNTGSAFYDVAVDPYSIQRLTLEKDLSDAIEADELDIHFQPKINLRTNMLVGAEALVRWTHRSRGAVPAGEIIELAEKTGLIKNLTYWMIDKVFRQCADWAKEGFYLPVGINLSAWNVQDAALAWNVENKLSQWKILPDQVEFEITESAMISDPASVEQTLERLNDIGIRLAVDDFGTGFSSLAYLKRLPVQSVKIDKSFVQNMCADDSDRSIVRSTIEMSHSLGLNVVAEGVETEETLRLLSELGCDIAQGFHISHPLPAGEFARWAAGSAWGSQPLHSVSGTASYRSGKNRLH